MAIESPSRASSGEQARQRVKIVILTDDRHSMGTLSGISRSDLDNPPLLPVLIDEIKGVMDRYEARHGPQAGTTGATEYLTATELAEAPAGLGVRLWKTIKGRIS